MKEENKKIHDSQLNSCVKVLSSSLSCGNCGNRGVYECYSVFLSLDRSENSIYVCKNCNKSSGEHCPSNLLTDLRIEMKYDYVLV